MGVQDLFKELRASKKLVTNLSDFSGKILGVDASIWLNKASAEISQLCGVASCGEIKKSEPSGSQRRHFSGFLK